MCWLILLLVPSAHRLTHPQTVASLLALLAYGPKQISAGESALASPQRTCLPLQEDTREAGPSVYMGSHKA